MVTETEQTQFNLTIIRESLTALASPRDKQLALNKQGLRHLDDVFDPLPLDYLPWLEDKNIVTPSFAKEFRKLHDQIERSIGHLEWQAEDVFIEQNNRDLQKWRLSAKKLLEDIDDV